MSTATFRIKGKLEKAGSAQEGTLTIDRATGVVSVRPLRSREAYSVPLDTVAEWVVRHCIFAKLKAENKLPAPRKTARKRKP
jgi:hypothetical protein